MEPHACLNSVIDPERRNRVAFFFGFSLCLLACSLTYSKPSGCLVCLFIHEKKTINKHWKASKAGRSNFYFTMVHVIIIIITLREREMKSRVILETDSK